MTSEEFQSRYRLLTQVTDGEVSTYHAIAPSGSVVMAHFLPPDAGNENRRLLALVESLAPAAKERVLKVAEVDGAPVVVTRFILEFATLHQWLQANAVATEPVAGPDEPETPPAATEPVIEPEMPLAVAEPDVPPVAEEAARTQEPADTEAPAEATEEEIESPAAGTGEFTQLFRVPALDPTLAPESKAVEAAPPADPAAEEAKAEVEPERVPEPRASSGEFTQLFRRLPVEGDPASTSPALSQPASSDTQEFAGLFGTASEQRTASAETAPVVDPSLEKEPRDKAAAGTPSPPGSQESTVAPRPDAAAPPMPDTALPPGKPERATIPLPGRHRPTGETRPASPTPWPQDAPFPAAELPPPASGQAAGADAGSAKEPGELTRLFQRPQVPAEHPTPAPPREPSAPTDPELFRPAAVAAEGQPPAPQIDYSTNYLDRLHGGAPPKQPPGGPAAAPGHPLPPPHGIAGRASPDRPPAAPPPPPVHGPSEYTQVISAQSTPFPVEPRPPVAAPRPAPLPPRRGASRFLLLFGLGFIFVAAVALVLYFVLTT